MPDLPALTLADGLTREERTAVALDALVNWCWNTEQHLRGARRLKDKAKRLPIVLDAWGCPDPCAPARRWPKYACELMRRMAGEIRNAEPDTAETVGDAWDAVDPAAFLAEIPDPD